MNRNSPTSDAQDQPESPPQADPRTARVRSFAFRLSTPEMELVIAALEASGQPGAAELAVRLRSIYAAWLPDWDASVWSKDPS